MQVERLSLRDYRNLSQVDVELHPIINVVHGDNAQGKTNLLEAIFILATLKSFRGSKTNELIAWEHAEAAIGAAIVRKDVRRGIVMKVRPGGKVVHIDGKRAGSLADTFGHVHAVLFAPEDLALSKGSASNRRLFLDRAIFNVEPIYFEEMRTFERALKSRNALLRDSRERGLDAGLLAVFDTQLAAAGARIAWRRVSFVAAFCQRVAQTHAELSHSAEPLGLRYECTLGAGQEEDMLREAYAGLLVRDRGKDIARAATSAGPHVDDLLITLAQRPARAFASQGQHRTIVLALKLAELDYIEHILGMRPVLLLDDVSSELDRHRNAQLLSQLERSGGQVVVTTTDPAYLAHRGEARHFHVQAGHVIPQENSP